MSAATASTKFFDRDANAWTTKADLAQPASRHCVAHWDDNVLFVSGGALGGAAGGPPTDEAYLWDYETGAVTALEADMPSPRQGHACHKVTYQDKQKVEYDVMVVAGGFGVGDDVLDTADIYRPFNDTVPWTEGPQMLQPVALARRIYSSKVWRRMDHGKIFLKELDVATLTHPADLPPWRRHHRRGEYQAVRLPQVGQQAARSQLQVEVVEEPGQSRRPRHRRRILPPGWI